MTKSERAHPLEPRRSPFEHGDGGGATGHETTRAMNGDRLEAARRLAGARIEHVAMAHTRHFDEALVVAAGRNRAGCDRKGRDKRRLAARMADTHAPRRAIGLRSQDCEIAREIHERALRSRLAQHRGGAIDGVLPAETAEIELHARSRQARTFF